MRIRLLGSSQLGVAALLVWAGLLSAQSDPCVAKKEYDDAADAARILQSGKEGSGKLAKPTPPANPQGAALTAAQSKARFAELAASVTLLDPQETAARLEKDSKQAKHVAALAEVRQFNNGIDGTTLNHLNSRKPILEGEIKTAKDALDPSKADDKTKQILATIADKTRQIDVIEPSLAALMPGVSPNQRQAKAVDMNHMAFATTDISAQKEEVERLKSLIRTGTTFEKLSTGTALGRAESALANAISLARAQAKKYMAEIHTLITARRAATLDLGDAKTISALDGLEANAAELADVLAELTALQSKKAALVKKEKDSKVQFETADIAHKAMVTNLTSAKLALAKWEAFDKQLADYEKQQQEVKDAEAEVNRRMLPYRAAEQRMRAMLAVQQVSVSGFQSRLVPGFAGNQTILNRLRVAGRRAVEAIREKREVNGEAADLKFKFENARDQIHLRIQSRAISQEVGAAEYKAAKRALVLEIYLRERTEREVERFSKARAELNDITCFDPAQKFHTRLGNAIKALNTNLQTQISDLRKPKL